MIESQEGRIILDIVKTEGSKITLDQVIGRDDGIIIQPSGDRVKANGLKIIFDHVIRLEDEYNNT